jgi:hypothetical protein
MCGMAVIDDTRRDLEARLEELQPYLDEAAQIRRHLKAWEALEDGGGGAQVRHLPVKTRKLQLLSVLRDRSVWRVKEIAEALDVTPGRVVQLVNELEEDETARRVEGGVEITPIGMEQPEIKITTGKWEEVPQS